MTIEKFEPRSSLVVEENIVTRAKYPFVDVHSHWFRAPTMTEGAIDTPYDGDGRDEYGRISKPVWRLRRESSRCA